MRRGVRRGTSAVLLMCQRSGGLLPRLVVVTEAALALSAVIAGKIEKETAASKCSIWLLHDL